MTPHLEQKRIDGYLEFLHRAVIQARLMAWSNVPHEQIGDLLDAIHNLPHGLGEHRDSFDEKMFEMFLRGYDEKWGEVEFAPGCASRLAVILEDCLQRAGEK